MVSWQHGLMTIMATQQETATQSPSLCRMQQHSPLVVWVTEIGLTVSPLQFGLGYFCGGLTLSWLCRFLMRSKHCFEWHSWGAGAWWKMLFFGRNDGRIRNNSWEKLTTVKKIEGLLTGKLNCWWCFSQ